MFLSTMQTLPFEGPNVAYQCKGLDQSNIVYEYEVICKLMKRLKLKNKTWREIVKEQ